MNSENSNSSEDIVQVPVPRRHLAAVIRALADAMRESEPTQSKEGEASTGVKAWTEDELVALRQKIANRPAPMALMNLAADRPGSGVPFQEVCEAAGVSQASARGALAGLTQLVKQLHHTEWPVNAEWKVDENGEGGHMEYAMPPDVAAIWRKT